MPGVAQALLVLPDGLLQTGFHLAEQLGRQLLQRVIGGLPNRRGYLLREVTQLAGDCLQLLLDVVAAPPEPFHQSRRARDQRADILLLPNAPCVAG